MKLVRIAMAPMAALLVAACATGDSGKKFDDAYVSKIQKNVTTKAQIRQNIGEPHSITTSSTGETWMYQYTTAYTAAYTKAATFGIIDDKPINRQLIVVFEGDRVVEYQYTK